MYGERMSGLHSARRWKASNTTSSVTPMNVANHCHEPWASANVSTAASPMPITPGAGMPSAAVAAGGFVAVTRGLGSLTGLSCGVGRLSMRRRDAAAWGAMPYTPRAPPGWPARRGRFRLGYARRHRPFALRWSGYAAIEPPLRRR